MKTEELGNRNHLQKIGLNSKLLVKEGLESLH